MRKNFRVPFCLKLSKASYANFRKSILDRERIVIKITFNLLKSSKSKNHRIKEFYFHEDEPVALTIFSSRGSAVSIDLESRLTHSLVLFSAKQQWQGYFFFLFFFSSQEIVHRRMFWLKLYARSLITIRPAIRTFYSPDPCVKPAAKTNYTNPIEDYSYPIDSDFLARGFEIVFGWKRVENIWS